jgi:hypothetical protein
MMAGIAKLRVGLLAPKNYNLRGQKCVTLPYGIRLKQIKLQIEALPARK